MLQLKTKNINESVNLEHNISYKNEDNKNKNFNAILSEKMDGFTIAILVEAATISPKPITNKMMHDIYGKNKSTITNQIKKLTSLGLIKKVPNLIDVRTKPYILTEVGASFLSSLHCQLTKYILRDKIVDKKT